MQPKAGHRLPGSSEAIEGVFRPGTGFFCISSSPASPKDQRVQTRMSSLMAPCILSSPSWTDVEKSYVNAGMLAIGISSVSQLPQSGIGITASGLLYRCSRISPALPSYILRMQIHSPHFSATPICTLWCCALLLYFPWREVRWPENWCRKHFYSFVFC